MANFIFIECIALLALETYLLQFYFNFFFKEVLSKDSLVYMTYVMLIYICVCVLVCFCLSAFLWAYKL